MEYNQVKDNLPETVIILDRVPKSMLTSISKEYSKEIKAEGITEFIEFDFNGLLLKFRLQS